MENYVFPSHKLKRLPSIDTATGLNGGRGAPAQAVLVACGSFNPITNMHLRLLESARDYLKDYRNVDVLGGFISPVHDSYGKKGLVSSNHRIQICELACNSSDWIAVDTWEHLQDSYITTRKALQHFQLHVDQFYRDLGHRVQIMLVCGVDLLRSFFIPGVWLEEDIKIILSQFGIVVFERDGEHPHQTVLEFDMLTKYRHNILTVRELVRNDISSTKIRRALSMGYSIKYLVPDEVIDYIREHGLYRPSDDNSSV